PVPLPKTSPPSPVHDDESPIAIVGHAMSLAGLRSTCDRSVGPYVRLGIPFHNASLHRSKRIRSTEEHHLLPVRIVGQRVVDTLSDRGRALQPRPIRPVPFPHVAQNRAHAHLVRGDST